MNAHDRFGNDERLEDEHSVFLKTDHPEPESHENTSVRSPTMKIDADEKELLESVKLGEWKSAAGGKREQAASLATQR